MRTLYSTLEHGGEVTLWQLNRNSDFGTDVKEDFTAKNMQVRIKLHQRGQYLVQAVLAFAVKGGYLGKALNRRKGEQSD